MKMSIFGTLSLYCMERNQFHALGWSKPLSPGEHRISIKGIWGILFPRGCIVSQADICVIYNPAAGRGQTSQTLRRLRRIVGSRAEYRATAEPLQAIEMARQAAKEGFPVVAAAGGDGTVHEVGNGLLLEQNHDAIFAVVPNGSANDYAYSLGLAPEWWRFSSPHIGPRQVDVGLIRSGERQRYFLNCLGVGFNGAVTLEARKIRRLRGLPLYILALMRALKNHYVAPVQNITFDDEEKSLETFALTFGIGQREGKFQLTPKAIIDDGLFDYLHIGLVSKWRALTWIPRIILGKLPVQDPQVTVGRCRAATIAGSGPLIIHADGEFFCAPQDQVQSVEIEILPKRLKVIASLR